MFKIKDIEEASLMNAILTEMTINGKTSQQLPELLKIERDYANYLVRKILDYHNNYETILFPNIYNNEDYYRFKASHETNEFLSNNGFEYVFKRTIEQDDNLEKINRLEVEKLELETDALKYQKQIRKQEDRIRKLEEKDLKLSVAQKYWWLITLIASAISFIITYLLKQ